ncbi:aspartate carbamoyltransferase regulatory subunit [Candidatus Woesearchaeota archaeon]|nr:aspartate carbamoyltransferase regulatory subunit [Candidatus Woesearchaeota archaeon]
MVKEIKIASIKDGTVLDHLNTSMVFKIVQLLNLDKTNNGISCATNLESTKLGTKGIIKVSDKFLTREEVEMISIISPAATLVIIQDYAIQSKRKLDLPETIRKIIKCSNPKCITNMESVTTQFDVLEKKPLLIKCVYCEHIIENNQIHIFGE